MRYRDLFSVALRHNYFSDSHRTVPEMDRYVRLQPEAGCDRLIRRYRLLLRKRPGSWHLTSPILESGSTFLPKRPVTFRFFLQVLDSKLFHFTDFSDLSLDRVLAGIEFPRYQNKEAVELSYDLFEYAARDFFRIRKERLVEDAFFLKSRPVPGLTTADFTITGLEPSSPEIIYDENQRRILFDTTPAQYSEGQVFQLRYRAVPEWAVYTFGLIDITVDGANISLDSSYTISFNRKSEPWQYLIIAAEETGATDLSIENGATGIPFEPAVEETSGETFQLLSESFPEAKFFRITSQTVVPYSNKARKGLKLKKEGEVIITDLPNPSPEKQGIAILNIHP